MIYVEQNERKWNVLVLIWYRLLAKIGVLIV